MAIQSELTGHADSGLSALPLFAALRRRASRLVRFLRSYISVLGLIQIALAVACLGAFYVWGWHELLAMGLVALSTVTIGIVMSLGNTAFSASIEMSRQRVSVGDDVHIEIIVNNPGRAATVTARGDLPIGIHHERFLIPPLTSGQSKSTTVHFKAVSRAVLDVGSLRVRKGDPFGLLRHETSLAGRKTLFIHPETVRLNPLNAGIVRDLEGQPNGRIVNDDLEFYGLREYKPGDDIRNVHWLSSSKFGTLMIRQYEATHRTDTSLTLDVNPYNYASAAEFEMAVSVHASVGVQCLIQDRPLFAHAGRYHVKQRRAMEFLDSCSAIAPDDRQKMNLADGTLEYSPQASLYCFTVGSLELLDNIKRMVTSLPSSSTTIVVQTDPSASTRIRRFPNFTLATLAHLDDLPRVVEAIS